MLYSQFLVAVTALCPLVSAHFKLLYPPARGFDEDTLPTFPCGGQPQSQNRSKYPLTGAPIQLDMGHVDTHIEVLIALGNDPGDAFNTVIIPTFNQSGLGDFCIGAGVFHLPSSLNVTDGTNATIQVVTNGDPGEGGGLYNCADITFTSTPLTAAEYKADCKNNTGVKAVLDDSTVNANTTTPPSSGADTAGPSSSLLVLGALAVIAGLAVY